MSGDVARYAEIVLNACVAEPNLAEAVKEFVLANTDSPDVPVHVEVVMVKSAFEWFFGIDENVNNFVRELMGAVGDFLVDCSSLPENIQQHWDGVSSKSIRPLEAWARAFCSLRGAAAHGKQVRHKRFRWSPEEHLAFASVLFPLLVRHRFAKAGILEDDAYDRARLSYIELLLVPELWNCADEDKHPWSEYELRCQSATLEHVIRREYQASISANEDSQSAFRSDTFPDE